MNWKRIFRPPASVAAILILAAVVLEILAFGPLNRSILQYVIYVYSIYALIVLILRLPAIFRTLGRFLSELGLVRRVRQIPMVDRYFTDPMLRAHISLYIGLVVNLVFAAIKFGYGLNLRSSWFIALGVYYLVLAVMKFSLLRHIRRKGIRRDVRSEWRSYRRCGIILLAVNLLLVILVMEMLGNNRYFSYPGLLIYAMATYAFYNVTNAIMNVVRFGKRGSPVFSAAKHISMCTALVSMLSLTTGMLAEFSSGSSAFNLTMTFAVGTGVCLLVFGISIYMILRASLALRKGDFQ